MLEKKLMQDVSKRKLVVYEPLKEDLIGLYGKIDMYEAEKSFASAKCCMCCF